MAEIPPDEVTPADIEQWYRICEQLAALKKSEILLRMRIFKGKFPAPVEGTNKFELGDGYELKATHVIDRKIDEGALGANRQRFAQHGISVDDLVRWKPELAVRAYRTLTAEQMLMFDECLIIKPGTPQMEIVLPARLRPKAGDKAS